MSGAPSLLYVFSDGTYEIEQKNNDMLGLDDFIQKLATLAPGTKPELDQLLEYARDIQGCPNFDDDFSIMRIEL
ncbi:MAG: hypothetical protein M2R45_01623 [Verrucomicrobia subdivision 3 bacterium]|nr:hypothetical protein [Limisphaerales bacterium]MCS1412774.1 hypothetical protein [Limisphaerales bacterium]